MGWPYTTSWYFENGAAQFGTETDGGTPAQGDFAHYTELARRGMTPYMGAYSYRIQLNGNAETAFIDDTDAAMATGETAYAAFALYLSTDFALASSAVIDIWLLEDATADCAAIRLINDSGTLRFQVTHEGDETDDVTASSYNVPLGKWMWLEIEVGHDTSTEGGISTLYVTEEGSVTAQQIAVTEGTTSANAAPDGASLGVVTNATTGNVGTMLFDAYHWHDPADQNAGRINAPERRWTTTQEVHTPMHVFVGPGCLENLTLIGSDLVADSWAVVYDTDRAQADPDRLVGVFHNTAIAEIVDVAGMPVKCQNGCYIELYKLGAPTNDGYGTLVHSSAVTGGATQDAPRAIAQISPKVFGSRSRVSDYGLSRPPI